MDVLPSYAAPLFIRIQNEMTVTGTFKHIKTELVKDGIDPSKVKNIYYRNDNLKTFCPFTSELYAVVCNSDVPIEKLNSPKM